MKTTAGITGTFHREQDQACRAELLERCLVVGASVTATASPGGIDANLLFKWRRDLLRLLLVSCAAFSSSAVLVPVQIASGIAVEAGNSYSAPSLAWTELAVAPQCSTRTTGIV